MCVCVMRARVCMRLLAIVYLCVRVWFHPMTANSMTANCMTANFMTANCMTANFMSANCMTANIMTANCMTATGMTAKIMASQPFITQFLILFCITCVRVNAPFV